MKKTLSYPPSIHRTCIDSFFIPITCDMHCILPEQEEFISSCYPFIRSSCVMKRPICHCAHQNWCKEHKRVNCTNCTGTYCNYDVDDNLDHSISHCRVLAQDGCYSDVDKNYGACDIVRDIVRNDNQTKTYKLNDENEENRTHILFTSSFNQGTKYTEHGQSGVLSETDLTKKEVIKSARNVFSPAIFEQNLFKTENIENLQNNGNFSQSTNNEVDCDITKHIKELNYLSSTGLPSYDINKLQTICCLNQNEEHNFVEPINDNLSEMDSCCDRNYCPVKSYFNPPNEKDYMENISNKNNLPRSSSTIRDNGNYDSKQQCINSKINVSSINKNEDLKAVSKTFTLNREGKNLTVPGNNKFHNNSYEIQSNNLCQSCKSTPQNSHTNQEYTKELHSLQNIRLNKCTQCRTNTTSESMDGYNVENTNKLSPFKTPSIENILSKNITKSDNPFNTARSNTKMNISNNSKSSISCYGREDAQQQFKQMKVTRLPDRDVPRYKEYNIKFDTCTLPEQALDISKFPNCKNDRRSFERLMSIKQSLQENPSKLSVSKQCVGMKEKHDSQETKFGNCCNGVSRIVTPERRIDKAPFGIATSNCECNNKSYQIREDGGQNNKECACKHGVVAVSSATTTCVNDIAKCCCRYPPAFQQFSCAGNIIGCCYCTDND